VQICKCENIQMPEWNKFGGHDGMYNYENPVTKQVGNFAV